MRVRLLGLVLLAGCAGAAGARRPDPLRGTTATGWQRIVDGDSAGAAAAWRKAPAADGAALFGQASLAFERGELAAAVDGYLRLLELGAGGQARARALAPAAAARLRTLLDDLPDRTAAEARTLAVPRAALPWPAQAELAEIALGIARRRGDAALLQVEAGRAGCVREVTELSGAGRLPHLDLDAAVTSAGAGRRVSAAGCRLLLAAVEGHAGVRALVGAVDLPAGGYDLALAFSGPALLRVDGGAWHRHGSADRFGPRWSAARVALGRGPHRLEVRLGTFGGATELTVMALPAAEPTAVAAEDSPLDDLAGAVSGIWTGEADAALEPADRLATRRRFALGLAAAGRAALQDPSRPSSLGRDAARTLFRKAVDVDPGLARVWRELAILDMTDDRPREAEEAVERAVRATPGYWPATLTLSEALRARGFERQADRTLQAARASGGCAALEAALRRARELGDERDEAALVPPLTRCDPQADALLDRLRVRGDLEALERALRARLPTSADPSWLRTELAQVVLARGGAAAAAETLRALAAESPRESNLRLRLADALVAAGARDRARAVLAEAMRDLPTRPEVRQAARALGIPSPMDPFRLDGQEVIRAFAAAGRRYDAPAVMLLDRTVERVLGDGARLVLTHNIVRVQSKDGIARWGEVNVPEGAELLTLRTHKPDGTVHEPEEIVGKATISAPDLAVGDYVEWETLETREPTDAFAPGFLGDRFYFQSPEAPLDRSEYLVVTPPGLALEEDRRAGAPTGVAERGPEGTHLVRYATGRVPQLFPERAAVPAVEWIPSVRVSSGVTALRWTRFLADQLHGIGRGAPSLRRLARSLEGEAHGDRARLPGLIAAWVSEHIEPEADLLEPASFSLARGRGNRAAVMLALARLMGVPADVVFARPLTAAASDAPLVAQELDDFSEVVVRFSFAGGEARFVDPRLRHAPFGYLPPTLEGAPALVPSGAPAALARVVSAEPDRRRVHLAARLGSDGAATAEVTEELRGWPALEWVEMMDRAGEDRAKLRQEFEQHWLSQNFPGAVLGDLQIEHGGGAAGTPVVVRYSFTHPELAVRDGAVLRLAPTFFRAQPGHRYAAEARRRTTLLLGYDVPLELEARLQLPPGARLLDAGDSGTVAAGPQGAVRFAESREVHPGEVILRRELRLPLVRVAPPDYPAVAAQLRRVDPLEQSEIRLELPPSADGRLGGAGRDPAVH